MTTKYYALLTNLGAAKLANAAALGTQLQITQMAVGDGGGSLPTPDATQTKLVGEKRRAALNSLSIDAANSSQIIAEQVIPESEGGFWIREIGLFDADGVLIAVANCAETYKPQLQEGSGRTQTVRMILIVSSTDAVTLKIDPSIVLATRQYVDNAVIEVKAYADDLMAEHLADTDPHKQYAPKASPTFTGTPKAPTAAAGKNDTQIATTAFVQAAFKALLSSETDSKSELLAATPKAISDAIALIKALLGSAAGKNVGVAAGQIPDMSFFEAVLTNQSGYQKLPGGLILQWGTATGTGSLLRATYGVAFPSIVFQVLFTMADKTAGALSGLTPFSNASYLTNLTQATCNLAGTDSQGNASCRYFAVGM